MDNKITPCKCGSEKYYIKQSYKGTCNFVMRFDGNKTDEDENWNMHEHTVYKNLSKYAYCCGCNKKLFIIEQN